MHRVHLRCLISHSLGTHVHSLSKKPLLAVAFQGGSTERFSTESRTLAKRDALSASSLHRAALLARLSGFCYYPPEQLAGKLEQEGMKLVVSGTTSFTKWYVADGPLDWRPSKSSHPSPPKATAASRGGRQEAEAPPAIERVILLRGVVWQGKDVNAFKMWQDLMRFWPTAFADDHTPERGLLFAHAGVADMAGQLYDSLAIPVQEAVVLNRKINFGGHSLGGSLALLCAVLFRLRLPVPPALLHCCTFGSPPVLSHGKGAGGDGVVQVLGLQKGSLQSFVLENDPVPRALLSVDPTFTAFKQSRVGAALLKLRHSFLGPGVPLTPERFLADNVGQVNLIRWTPETGHKVTPLEPGEMEEQLRIVNQEAGSTFTGIVDHAHGSYSLDLDAAARQLEQELI